MTEKEYESFKNFIHTLLYEKMSIDDYYIIMDRLGAKRKGDRFTTICHNIDGGKYNLAFIEDTRTFYCHSECCCSYSLLSLIKKRKELLGEPHTTYKSLKWLCNELGVEFNFKEEIKQINQNIYKWQNSLSRFIKNGKQNKELTKYDKHILDCFENSYHKDWLDYGISEKTLEKYKIKWYNYRNQIVIPCYNEFGDLIGIRIRNMSNDNDVPKYMPLEMLNKFQYKFPTNMVFYGENFNMQNVERTKSVILVEAEKTVLKYDDWFGEDNNICLALYGSNLGSEQLKKLLEHGVENFYIALDSDFHEIGDNEEYKKFENKVLKIYDMIKPYSTNIYVIYNNLGYKDCYKFSITDYTKEQYLELWKNKEIIDGN